MMHRKINRELVLPYSVVMHHLSISFLHHQYNSLWDLAFWVSVKDNKDVFSKEEHDLSHCIVFQCLRQMLGSGNTQRIPCKTECGECLQGKNIDVNKRSDWNINSTVLCSNAIAKCLAPSTPIKFHDNSNVLNVYIQSNW